MGGFNLNIESPLAEYNCSQNSSKITLDSLTFEQNVGWIGGGLAIVGFCQEQETHLSIKSCRWNANQARCGAAVSILRSLKDKGQCHSLPTITFSMCEFEENANDIVYTSDNNTDLFYLEGWTGEGIFFVVFFDVVFTGEQTLFRGNTNSGNRCRKTVSFDLTMRM